MVAVGTTIMAPGTSAMLRARRKDTNVKPNRTLDRTSSRGMMFENEELRLRTININDDLEKGQQYIKKLRRENEHLRKEIWNLRDQYDRLETLLRNKQLQGELDDGEFDEDEYDGTNEVSEDRSEITEENVQETVDELIANRDQLSTVEEEPEETLNFEQDGANISKKELVPDGTSPSVDRPVFNTNNSLQSAVVNDESNFSTKRVLSHSEVVKSISASTFKFSTENFDNLTVEEIIDDIEESLSNTRLANNDVIKSVRVEQNSCSVTVQEDDDQTEVIRNVLFNNQTLRIRGKPVDLQHPADDVIVSINMSQVPSSISDQYLADVLSSLGDVIGDVTRKTYKGIDIGNRHIRLRLRNNGRLLSSIVNNNNDNDQNGKSTKSQLVRRKSFRSQININLKVPSVEPEQQSKGGADVLVNAETGIISGDQQHNQRSQQNQRSHLDNILETDDKRLPTSTTNNVLSNKTVATPNSDIDVDNCITSNSNGNAPSSGYQQCISTGVAAVVPADNTPTPTQTTLCSSFSTTGYSTTTMMTNFPETANTVNNSNTNNNNNNNVSGKTFSRQTSCSDLKDGKQSSTIVESSNWNSSFNRNSQKRIQRGASFKFGNENNNSTSIVATTVGPTNRKPSVNFRKNSNGDAFRRPSGDYGYSFEVASHHQKTGGGGGSSGRERSSSDVSSRASICKRKLSVTGHEGTAKIPWCGCWGTGCC